MRMQTQNRAGFTLVELMVSMALTLFVMVILSQAFATSLETFTQLKAIGDMQENLRAATIILRDDLSQDHFEGKRRLSETDLLGRPLIVAQPPQAGFFAIKHGSGVLLPTTPPVPGPPPVPLTWPKYYYNEGTDTNGMPSYRATDHILYMTVKRKGNRPQSFFTTKLTGTGQILNTNVNTLNPPLSNASPIGFFGQQTAYDVRFDAMPDATLSVPHTNVALGATTTSFYSSQWAEVVYYLKRQGSTQEPNLPTSVLGTPTFDLYRAQLVMVPDGTNVSNKYASNLGLQNTTFAGLSCNPGATQLEFYSPADAARGVGKRIIPNLATFDPQAVGTVNTRVLANETLLVPNVISFQVQVMPVAGAVTGAGAFTGFGDVLNGGIYDTAQMNSSTYFNKTGLKAVQVTIRVFDYKSRQTRQISIVQDM